MVKVPARVISDLSSLTRVQVETIKLQRALQAGQINMDDALNIRKNFSISRGTHYRILEQAKKNIARSLFTVASAVQLGLVKPEDVQRLISAVAAIPDDVDPEKLPELLALVTVLADRIVML